MKKSASAFYRSEGISHRTLSALFLVVTLAIAAPGLGQMSPSATPTPRSAPAYLRRAYLNHPAADSTSSGPDTSQAALEYDSYPCGGFWSVVANQPFVYEMLAYVPSILSYDNVTLLAYGADEVWEGHVAIQNDSDQIAHFALTTYIGPTPNNCSTPLLSGGCYFSDTRTWPILPGDTKAIPFMAPIWLGQPEIIYMFLSGQSDQNVTCTGIEYVSHEFGGTLTR